MTDGVTRCDGENRVDVTPSRDAASPPFAPDVPRHPECGSHARNTPEISSKTAWGGARPNSGGARPNSGGARPGAGRKPRQDRQPDALTTLGPRWHCVQTWPRHERLVAAELTRRGLTTHLPEFARITGQDQVMLVPLFPGYLFVRFDVAADPWRCIARLPGVACLFSVNERPIPLPVGVVERLIEAIGPDGAADRDADPLRPVPVGVMVRIDSGPFAGLLGLVEACDRLTARVLLMVLGRHTPVTVPRRAISAV